MEQSIVDGYRQGIGSVVGEKYRETPDRNVRRKESHVYYNCEYRFTLQSATTHVTTPPEYKVGHCGTVRIPSHRFRLLEQSHAMLHEKRLNAIAHVTFFAAH
jgi:hypothetical protein